MSSLAIQEEGDVDVVAELALHQIPLISDTKLPPLPNPLPQEAVSQCSGAIYRTQNMASDKSDRYKISCDYFEKWVYDTASKGRFV
ncbi:MAG: hypothetical protein KAW16_03940 [candidate division Zixibacteria bacterium]|nr:hypothetical protein [candidate division Zixibacteria bacterium]